MSLSRNGKALIVTMLFFLLFGGYLIGLDLYHFNDVESALTVLFIYVLFGIFTTLFLFGKRHGLFGLMALDIIFIILQTIFVIISLSQITNVGLHNPLANWWATLFMYLFSLLTLMFSVRVYKEN